MTGWRDVEYRLGRFACQTPLQSAVPSSSARRRRFRTWLLMTDADALPLDESYFALGLTSLGAVEIQERLESILGRRIDSSSLFNNPTIDHLLLHLRNEVLPEFFRSSGARQVVTPESQERQRHKQLLASVLDEPTTRRAGPKTRRSMVQVPGSGSVRVRVQGSVRGSNVLRSLSTSPDAARNRRTSSPNAEPRTRTTNLEPEQQQERNPGTGNPEQFRRAARAPAVLYLWRGCHGDSRNGGRTCEGCCRRRDRPIRRLPARATGDRFRFTSGDNLRPRRKGRRRARPILWCAGPSMHWVRSAAPSAPTGPPPRLPDGTIDLGDGIWVMAPSGGGITSG